MLSAATSHSEGINDVTPLQDENGNYIEPEDACAADLQQQLIKLHASFVAVGKEVKEVVDQRTELYKELDSQIDTLTILQVQEEETGIDDIDEDDPLRFIDSDYPFFREAETCTFSDISNVEDPKKCLAAMDNFVKVLHDNIHRFKHLPKGPLYKEIRLKSKQWAPLVEHVLRPYLFSFLVDNIVDGLVIHELIAQHFPSAEYSSIDNQGVVCPKQHLHVFGSKNKFESRLTAIVGLELENMMECIYFDDEDWGNFLSVEMNIEKIIFMDNENAAFLVMSHIRSTPWHCKIAYTLDGFCVYPFPNFCTKKIQFHSRPMYLKCVPNADIMVLNTKIRKTKEKITSRDKEIAKKREMQMDLALQLDAIGLLYAKAKAREKQLRPKTKKKTKKTKKSGI